MKNASADLVRTLQLPEVLDLKAAAPLVADLLALRGGDLVVDASRVQRLGAQCVQVLLSAMATWSADEISIEFLDPSPDFVSGLELLGFPAADFMNTHLPH